MTLTKKVLASAIGALVLSGSAVAASVTAAGTSLADVSVGGKGDLLVAPLFMTGGGWETELKVVNTDTINSVVAKVVIHAPTDSSELRDFLIYLTPGDVWTGTIKQVNGVARIISTDDSAVIAPVVAGTLTGQFCPTGTSTKTGFDIELTQNVASGYVNIFETRLVTGLGSAPVKKADLLKKYSDLCVAGTPIAATDTANVLSGTTKITNPGNGNQLSLPMQAIKNYGNSTYHSVGQLTSFADPAISTKTDVEGAIWATDFVVPYKVGGNNLTFASVTFPTKEAFWSAAAARATTQYTGFTAVPRVAGKPFSGAPVVAYQVRDEQENIKGCNFSPCATASLVNEVSLVQVSPGGTSEGTTATNVFTEDFTTGWVNMSIQPQVSAATNTNAARSGAPAIVTVLQWVDMGAQGIQGSWGYAAATK